MADGELYTVFVDSSPALPLPPQTTDEIAIVRAGVTYRMAPTDISGGGIGPTVYIAPLDGDTITAVIGQGAFRILPAGTIATATMVLPPSPADRGIFEASTTNEITALTVQPAAGDSVAGTAGGPFILSANAGVSYEYRFSDTTWYPRYNDDAAGGGGGGIPTTVVDALLSIKGDGTAQDSGILGAGYQPASTGANDNGLPIMMTAGPGGATSGDGGAISLGAGAGVAGDGSGGQFSINGGLGVGAGGGGNLSFAAGNGGATAGVPGGAFMNAGNATGGNRQGGNATITAGDGSGNQPGGLAGASGGNSTSGNGGDAAVVAGNGGTRGGFASLTGGSATADGNGGIAAVTGGAGLVSGNGGAASLVAGSADNTGAGTGNGGDAVVTGGNGGGAAAGSGDGGAVRISGGNAAAGSGGSGGGVAILLGTKDGAGVRGRLNVTGLPTSAAGLASGDIWLNTNVLTIVP